MSGFSPCGICFQPFAIKQRLKPAHFFAAFAARLKSCPVTEPFRHSAPPELEWTALFNDSNAIAPLSTLPWLTPARYARIVKG
jgi:hypothetical protein